MKQLKMTAPHWLQFISKNNFLQSNKELLQMALKTEVEYFALNNNRVSKERNRCDLIIMDWLNNN